MVAISKPMKPWKMNVSMTQRTRHVAHISLTISPWSTVTRPLLDIKLVASGLCRLLSGFPFFSEAIQVAYSNPERRLSRKRPPRCPSSKPSSMGGRSRKNDIIDHPASLTLPPGGFTAAIANSKPTPGRVGIQDFGPSALIHRWKCVSHVQPLPHAAC